MEDGRIFTKVIKCKFHIMTYALFCCQKVWLKSGSSSNRLFLQQN